MKYWLLRSYRHLFSMSFTSFYINLFENFIYWMKVKYFLIPTLTYLFWYVPFSREPPLRAYTFSRYIWYKKIDKKSEGRKSYSPFTSVNSFSFITKSLLNCSCMKHFVILLCGFRMCVCLLKYFINNYLYTINNCSSIQPNSNCAWWIIIPDELKEYTNKYNAQIS